MTHPLGAIVPAVPYPKPVPPPVLGSGAQCVSFDAAWSPYLIGVCKVFLASSTWASNDPAVVEATIKAANDLLLALSGTVDCPPAVPLSIGLPSVNFEGCDMQLRQNPDNPCQLQIQCADGTWETWADISLCQPSPAPGNNPPSVPPGGSGKSCFDFDARDVLPLPFRVSAGDTLTFSDIQGAGTDYINADWYCVDGSIYFLGICAGGGYLHSGDPLATGKHMELIFKIGSNYYPVTTSTFTVPSGVLDAVPYIQANTSTPGVASGKYHVCVTYQNSAAPPPGLDGYDFTRVDGGFVDARWQYNRPESVWTPGLGWGNTDANSIVSPGKQFLAAGHITRIVVHYVTTTHNETGGGVVVGTSLNDNSLGGFGPPTTSDGTNYTMDSGAINVSVTASDFLTIHWQNNNVNAANSQIVTSIEVYRSTDTPLI